MRHRPRQSGFVLLMVLMVVTLCAVVLASAARRSGQDALQANRAWRQLQFDWGASSCRKAVLTRADKLIESGRQPDADPPVQFRSRVTLGGMPFHLLVADESAKANANLLARQRRDFGLVVAATRLQTNGRMLLNVELRPRLVNAADKPAPDRFTSFDQLFRFRGPADLVGPDDDRTAVACRRMTFWSQGPVNLRRAELPVLREMLGGLLTEGDLEGLADYRRHEPKAAAIQILGHLRMPADRAKQLKDLVTDQSECFSLWVLGENRHSMSYRLYVQQQGAKPGKDHNLAFTWQP